MKLHALIAPAGVVALAVALVGPTRTVGADVTIVGPKLAPLDSWYRIYDNFSDPQANDNTAHDPNVPGASGAALAIRKAAVEWGTTTYGDGSGDPTQPNLGDGGSNAAFWFGGMIQAVGDVDDRICSALSTGGGCTPGILAFTEIDPAANRKGFRMRFCDGNAVFADGPGPIGPTEYDLQSVAAHEFGHVAGLGHATAACGDAPTMSPTIFPGDVSDRSIEAEDITALQAFHGTPSMSGVPKPVITDITFDPNGDLNITGANFPPMSFVRFTMSFPATTGFAAAFVPSQNGGTLIQLPQPEYSAAGDVSVNRVDAFTAPNDISAPYPFFPPGPSEPVFYCTPRASSIGCVTTITTSDPLAQPVSNANDYSVIAQEVHGFKPGLMFYGTSGPAAIFPWAGGYLCITPPLGRGFIQLAGGTGVNTCDGSYAQLVNDGGAFNPFLDMGPGIGTWFQYWYREPNNGAGMLGTALSDAVELVYQ